MNTPNTVSYTHLKPEDIARMCLFLCQEENDFINGQNIIIDGGMTKKMIYLE